MLYYAKKPLNDLSAAHMSMRKLKEFTFALPVGSHCSLQALSSTRERAGRASGMSLKKAMSILLMTPVTGCIEQKSCAANAVPTWATYSRMARAKPLDCATVSIQHRLHFRRNRRYSVNKTSPGCACYGKTVESLRFTLDSNGE